jgi:cytosine/adenosine deaminase-related metal-dependent hydrolase
MKTLLQGGRVIDPGSGFDGVTDVLIEDGVVKEIGPCPQPPNGTAVIDVTGLIVGPGFVDLHSHVNGIAGQRLQALDGVTTSLELEAGLMPVALGYAHAADEGRPLNYGFSASWAAARGQVLVGVDPHADIHATLELLGNPQWQRSSTAAEFDRWLGLLHGELEAGALGVGIVVGYAPRTDPSEFLAVARLAADAGVPAFTHVRELIESDPATPIDGPGEIVAAAAETGAHMHHCHVNSTSRRHVDRVLSTLGQAVTEGSRVTLEAYPYGAGSTGVGAAFLAPEHLPAWGIKPSNIILLPSGERIADEARLREVRATAPGTLCIIEFLDEANPSDRALLQRTLAYPDAIVASDAMPVLLPGGAAATREWPLPAGSATHPRTAGTYAKTMRIMVRETGTWDWLEAFRRCSWLPARVLDDIAPAARKKGHLGAGADADIVVLDPGRISDAATYLDSIRPSVGVQHLFVHGQAVVKDGSLVTDAYPGQPVRGEP